jgi:predicted ferric reductase
MGINGFYILLLVSATFYLKAAIGIRAFRLIHVLSLAGYVGATLHGLYAGTDSALALTRAIYLGTGLVIVFLTVYWLVLGAYSKREKMAASARLAPAIPGFDPGQRFSGHQR